MCSIRVPEWNSVYKSVSFIYPTNHLYLNTFMIELAHRCSDNESPDMQCPKKGSYLSKSIMVSMAHEDQLQKDKHRSRKMNKQLQ